MNRNELATYLATGICGRDINEIIVHCTATKPNVRADVATIDGWHRGSGIRPARGAADITAATILSLRRTAPMSVADC